MKFLSFFFFFTYSVVLPVVSYTQNNTDSSKNKTLPVKLKPYSDIITSQAITTRGLWMVHKIESRYFFEIPGRMLDRDLLVINRIAKSSTGSKVGELGFPGDLIGQSIIRLSRGPNNKLFLKTMSFLEQSTDSTDNGMYRSVNNANLPPLAASFDIKSLSGDSTGVVIDATEYLNGDNDILFFSARTKGNLGLKTLQADRSYINGVQVYPENVEIKTVKTFAAAAGFSTYELNSSILLLPVMPMKPRYSDKRVGYFETEYTDFDADAQGVAQRNLITRWRLEPGIADRDKYLRGELVEPVKPIIFYIDPGTPKKWVPYLIQGVNDWQKAFEKAGFKNAIVGRPAPSKAEDSTWSLEDARYSAFVYKPSAIRNASGPHINDPRSGEILESHINWYHNVLELLKEWYFIQASVVDARARKPVFDDELMGQLIRFVSCHEVGHTLGLRHNSGASSTVPVDSLRNKNWVEANGHTPSIMDYARFNYVAQPGDNISAKGIFPRIGVYDEWAIEWGYRWFPDNKTYEEEQSFMDNWIRTRQSKNKYLWFGNQNDWHDPRCQSEDLGDDAIKASTYGIQNLKRIVPKLVEWTKKPHEGYALLDDMYTALYKQYSRYLLHVANNINGIYKNAKTSNDQGAVFSFVSKEKQKEAIAFLNRELFTTPQWLLNKEIFGLTTSGSMYNIFIIQEKVLKEVLSNQNLGQLMLAEFNSPGYYQPHELLQDVSACIWREIRTKQYSIDIYRRNLQKTHVIQLINLLRGADRGMTIFTDVPSAVKAQLRGLSVEIKKALPLYKDTLTRWHLQDVLDRIEEALDSKK